VLIVTIFLNTWLDSWAESVALTRILSLKDLCGTANQVNMQDLVFCGSEPLETC